MTGLRATVWINGEPRDWDAAHISVRDRGLALGDGVFETMRLRGGTIFRLHRHLARLHHGLEVLGIPAPPRVREWVLTAAADAVRRISPTPTSGSDNAGGQTGDLAVRLMITRGVGPGGVLPPSQPDPTVVIVVGPMPNFPAAIYETGLRAQIATGRRNEQSATVGLKIPAYADAVVALTVAQRAGFDEAIFLDTEGHCSEATSSNLFVWTGEELLTPPLTCAALPGIVRRVVMEIARTLGIAAEERVVPPDLLFKAREAFLTSSLRGIAPLVQVHDIRVGDGVPGPVTRQIAAAYAAMVAHDCGSPVSARA
jgi:branched-chain amino acid aminotransferase